MRLKDIQAKLASLGYRTGPLDGVWGRQTEAAVKQYQADHGLPVDGVVGPQTVASLFATAPVTDAGFDNPILVWFQEARRLIGTREDPTAGSNPSILDWAQDRGIPYGGDDIPWCGLFVAHCVGSTLSSEPLPTNVLGARSWERFGVRTDPTPGAVMVFWRKSRQSGLGHVGFYAGEDSGAYRILGGNQSDNVSLAWVAKDRLVAARWPSSIPATIGHPVQIARTDTLSWNEA